MWKLWEKDVQPILLTRVKFSFFTLWIIHYSRISCMSALRPWAQKSSENQEIFSCGQVSAVFSPIEGKLQCSLKNIYYCTSFCKQHLTLISTKYVLISNKKISEIGILEDSGHEYLDNYLMLPHSAVGVENILICLIQIW